MVGWLIWFVILLLVCDPVVSYGNKGRFKYGWTFCFVLILFLNIYIIYYIYYISCFYFIVLVRLFLRFEMFFR